MRIYIDCSITSFCLTRLGCKFFDFKDRAGFWKFPDEIMQLQR